MTFTSIESVKGSLSLVEALENPLRKAGDLLDVLMNAPSDTVALTSEDLDPAFFELRSGVAGDMLQKVSTYRKRLIILGDFTAIESGALQDFIRESNQWGQVVFTATLDEAIAKLT